MILEFKEILIENFLLIKRAKIVFNLGLTLIDGVNQDYSGASSNGTGKSSLIEAIVWCLYGKTLRDIPVDSVIRKGSKEGCSVTLSFSVDKDSYQLIRTRHKGKSGISTVKLLKNGVDILPTSHYQEIIDAIIGLNFAVFTSTCVFSHNSQFKFIQLPNVKQKEIIEGLIEFGKYDIYREKVKEKISDLIDETVKLKANKIETVERLKSLEKEQARLEEWKKEISFKTENREKNKESKSLDELTALQIKWEKIHKKKEEENSAAVKADSELKTKKTFYTVSIEHIGNEIKRIKSLISKGKCPTCNQPVKESVFSKLIQEQEEKSKKVQDDLDKVVEERKSTYKLLQDTSQARDTAYMKRREIEKRIEIKKSSLEPVETQDRYDKRLSEIVDEIKNCRDEILYIDQRMLKVQRLGEHYNFLGDAFSRDGIESFLFDQLLPFLNERANYYVGKLSDNRIGVKFATLKRTKWKDALKDSFHVQVRALEGGESYGGCSSSEERYADLAVALAKRDLAKISGKPVPNILLLDEVADTIDDVGSKRVLAFLAEYSKDKTVWLISHNPELKTFFDQTITVVRNGGFSTIK